MCTANCGYKKKCIGRCQCSKRRILYLSLPIDSVGHCMRYGNIKLFSEPNTAVYEQKTKDIYGKIHIREKGYIRIFYPVYFTCVPSISLISSKNHSSLNKNNTLYWKKLIVKKFLVKQLLWFPNFQNTSFGFLSIARNMSIFKP